MGRSVPGPRVARLGVPRMADVAAAAGVSTATVSRALRGQPGVAEETRDRIRRAADTLRYAVSPAASRLASGRTGTVGVVVPQVSQWYHGRVIAGAGPVLREAGLDLLLYELADAAGRRRFFDRMPLWHRVDAVLLLTLLPEAAELALLRTLGVPLVLVGLTGQDCWSVGVDDVAGAAKAVRHLLALGHERIGLLSSAAVPGFSYRAPGDRRAGYRLALAEAGLPAVPGLQVAAPFGLAGGATAMGELLGLHPRPTAVFAESDELAFGALRTLRRAGLQPGRDLSLVGYDDHDIADLVDLSTVAQPVASLGATAAALLVEALADPAAPARAETLPTTLVVRGTTGPPERRRRRTPAR